MNPVLTKSKLLVTLGGDKATLEIWGLDDSRLRYTLKSHTDSISCFTVSDDETLVATGSLDGTVKVWKVETGVLVKTLKGHKSSVTHCRFPPNHVRFVVTGSTDRTVKIWNIESTQAVTMECHIPICACAVSSDSRIFVTAENNLVKIWNALGQLKHTINFEDPIVALRLTHDNQRLVVACQNQGIKVHHLMKSVPQKRFSHQGLLSGIELPAESSLLFAFGTDRACRLLLVSEEIQELHKFEGHTGAVTAVSYSPSEFLVASASEDKTVKLWDLTSKKEITCLKGHTSSVNCVKFSKCGKLVTSSGSDKNVIVWDIKTLSPKFDLFHARRVAAQADAVHEYDAKYFGEIRLQRRSDIALRKWKDGDQESLVKHANSKKISANMDGHFPYPYTLVDAIAWVDANDGAKHDPLQPTQLAVSVDNVGVVGGVGVTAMSDTLRRNMNLTFWIGESYWGQGIMTEAVSVFTDYVFDTFPDVHRIQAQVPEASDAAPKLLQTLGFRLEGRLKQAFVKNDEFVDLMIYGRLKSESPSVTESCHDGYSMPSIKAAPLRILASSASTGHDEWGSTSNRDRDVSTSRQKDSQSTGGSNGSPNGVSPAHSLNCHTNGTRKRSLVSVPVKASPKTSSPTR